MQDLSLPLQALAPCFLCSLLPHLLLLSALLIHFMFLCAPLCASFLSPRLPPPLRPRMQEVYCAPPSKVAPTILGHSLAYTTCRCHLIVTVAPVFVAAGTAAVSIAIAIAVSVAVAIAVTAAAAADVAVAAAVFITVAATVATAADDALAFSFLDLRP